MTVYSYIRNNYPKETLIQMETILNSYKIDELVLEKYNLSDDGELQSLLSKLNNNDTLIVASISAFGKSISELAKIMDTLNSKEIRFVSVEENIDTKEMYSFYNVLKVINITHKEVFSEKVKQQLVEVKKSGKQLGRPALSKEIVSTMIHLREEKKMSFRQISEYCGVSLGTAYKYIKD